MARSSVLLNVNGASPVGEATAQSQTKPVTVCCCIEKRQSGLAARVEYLPDWWQHGVDALLANSSATCSASSS